MDPESPINNFFWLGDFLMPIYTQNVSASSPFTLSQTDQIPFFFCAIPYHLIDSEVFPQLKGNHIKLLLVIDRYRNLKLKQKKFDPLGKM